MAGRSTRWSALGAASVLTFCGWLGAFFAAGATVVTAALGAAWVCSGLAAGGGVVYTGDVKLTDEQIAKLPFDLYRKVSRTTARPVTVVAC